MKPSYLILFFSLIGCGENGIPLRKDYPLHLATPQKCLSQNQKSSLIAHAGGGYQGEIYLNSLEAMTNSYKAGFKLFEIDFIQTSDGHYVAAHDWKHWSSLVEEKPKNMPPSLSEFLASSRKDKQHPLSYSDAQKWINSHPDTFLITDKIQDLDYLKEHTINQEQLIIEIFTFEKYVRALELGLTKPMLSLVKYMSDQEILDFASDWDVQYFAGYLSLPKTRKSLLNTLTERGACLYLFTSNDKEEIKEGLSKSIRSTQTLSPLQSLLIRNSFKFPVEKIKQSKTKNSRQSGNAKLKKGDKKSVWTILKIWNKRVHQNSAKRN